MNQPETIADGWHCPAERTLDLLAGKWRPMVIFWLMDGPLRFNELQRRLGAITHRTLSKTLKEMEADGLVHRKDYGEMPPRVDYSLTARGRSLKPVLQAMEKWAQTHAGR
ncbi:helix-turn-helix transcriptional regulator [Qipengyuania sp. 6D47A]|uniref:Helix-turn-helix transcriptional regulator n=2 Tax=Qipengyuania qiaonensis TaxID=2867240 RepID=A0ABS7JE32_9SPHN|nr:helix-turn-helix domain-containing protein [Qipengyuania qiaonensis]MBX7484109.1 helix-turn-helix transcriptional regulator [Qipengyuania qiaonensis]